ncbi:MAG TPA: hypothetical protein VGK94_03225 [Candidatus Polarisedimenticolia bacterium]
MKKEKQSDAPRTAYEIAMERLKKQDAERGETRGRLTERQKEEIAQVRRFYLAKVAEQEILHQSELRKARATREEESIRAVEESYQKDRRRLEEDMESKILAIRQAGE